MSDFANLLPALLGAMVGIGALLVGHFTVRRFKEHRESLDSTDQRPSR